LDSSSENIFRTIAESSTINTRILFTFTDLLNKVLSSED
jgi:hypothetical protein